MSRGFSAPPFRALDWSELGKRLGRAGLSNAGVGSGDEEGVATDADRIAQRLG